LSTKRIYVVDLGDERKLVRASNAQQAIHHVVHKAVSAHSATQDDIVNFLALGGEIEAAGRVPAQDDVP
jgi:hypothetical protein